ncbi:MAG: penicillin-binding protein 2 [Sphingobacteriaceae bacterium]|nr:penicillin-binding protein 2 [Sphingobacteriaceae bacterium]
MTSFFIRKYTIQSLFIFIFFILVCNLFYIQVISEKYYLSANNNALRKNYIFPARGEIVDRNHKTLVKNQPIYDLLVIPNQVKNIDTLLLCSIVDIDLKGFKTRLHRARAQSNYQMTIFERQVPIENYAALQEKLFLFPGFFVQPRTVRFYPDSVASQFLGYSKEVKQSDIDKSEGYYKLGDYIGKSGVERSYEKELRGRRGITYMLYDAKNNPKGAYQDGRFDEAAISGKKLISSLDLELQKLGEEIMKNKVGSIVAIEPSSGEVLAFVSSPGYNPNLMVGKKVGNEYMALNNNPYRPLNIRPIQGMYSPGSAFKPLDALIALQEGVIFPNSTFNCPGGYKAGNHYVRCEHVDGKIDLRRGLARSCNTYFCQIFAKLILKNGYKNQKATYDLWQKKVRKFGIGDTLGIDLPFEKSARLFTSENYSKRYGKYWGYTNLISLSIGQGEINTTPLQMANIMSIIANKGYYIKPHVIKAIGEKKLISRKYTEKHYVDIDTTHFNSVIDGMQDAVNMGWGTATESRIPNIIMCGKTGTVQNSHGKNHSVFIGFAPRNNPKIALAVIVENGGYGGSYAAPIASFMTEKYINRKVSNRSINGSTLQMYKDANLLPKIKTKKPSVTTPQSNTTKITTAKNVK